MSLCSLEDFLEVLFVSDGMMEQEIEHQIEASSAILSILLQSVGVKKVPILIYGHEI